jgi:hypothetical protein
MREWRIHSGPGGLRSSRMPERRTPWAGERVFGLRRPLIVPSATILEPWSVEPPITPVRSRWRPPRGLSTMTVDSARSTWAAANNSVSLETTRRSEDFLALLCCVGRIIDPDDCRRRHLDSVETSRFASRPASEPHPADAAIGRATPRRGNRGTKEDVRRRRSG